MSIDPKVKEIIKNRIEKAIAMIEKSEFETMLGIASRLALLTEVFPNEDWDGVFLLSSFVIGSIGASTDSEFKELAPDKKSTIIKEYSKLLSTFNEAIMNEKREQAIDVLKALVKVFTMRLVNRGDK